MASALPLGELFILGFSGATVPDWLRDFAQQRGLGGVILFDYDWRQDKPERNILDPAQVRALCAEVHALPGRPLVCVDQEGGRVRRLKEERGFAPLPSQEALAALPVAERRAALQRSFAELKALGIDLDLAPVVDLNLNPASPDIGALQRSYGADPAVVRENALLADEVARALHLALCLKHWPGLGGATGNTHKELTDLSDTVDAAQLALFAELGARIAGQGVMVSHGFVRQWDDEVPCSVSAAGLARLRKALPDALLLSDDLQMGALQAILPTGEACLQGLRAGLDLLLIGNNLLPEEDAAPGYAAALEAAVGADGALAQRAAEALARVRRLKAWVAG